MEDDTQREVVRKQVIGTVLFMGLAFLWIHFYMPPTPPPIRPAGPETAAPEPVEPLPAAEPAAGQRDQWPHLPEVAEPLDDPAADEVTLEGERMRVVFTRVGARIKQAYARYGVDFANEVPLVPEQTGVAAADARYPLGLTFSEPELDSALDARRWDVAEVTDTSVLFRIELPGAAVVTKRFSINGRRVVDIEIGYTNRESAPRMLGYDDVPAYQVTWAPDVRTPPEHRSMWHQLVWRDSSGTEHLDYSALGASGRSFFSYLNPFASSAPPEFINDAGLYDRELSGVEWIAVKAAYFVVALRATTADTEAAATAGLIRGKPENYAFGLAVPRLVIEPGATATSRFQLYVGPSEKESLEAAWPSLDSLQRFFMWPNVMDWFAKFLLDVLHFFYSLIPNYGVAIILLTVLVRTIMFPLTLKQMRSMKRMQSLAPEMEELKKKYGEDPQEMQKRLMLLYRERNVNPLSGCLPLLVQMPVFIALYRMLWYSFEMLGAPFALWIDDLANPDRLYHFEFLSGIPLLSHFEYLNVLPILAAIAMIASTEFMTFSNPVQNPQQKFLMRAMPVLFSVICYNFASGLNLYILTSTVLGIMQTRLLHVKDDEEGTKKARPAKPRKRRHFYAAAQAKKREMKKEMQRDKRRDGAPAAKPKDKPRAAKGPQKPGSGAAGGRG